MRTRPNSGFLRFPVGRCRPALLGPPAVRQGVTGRAWWDSRLSFLATAPIPKAALAALHACAWLGRPGSLVSSLSSLAALPLMESPAHRFRLSSNPHLFPLTPHNSQTPRNLSPSLGHRLRSRHLSPRAPLSLRDRPPPDTTPAGPHLASNPIPPPWVCPLFPPASRPLRDFSRITSPFPLPFLSHLFL